MTKEIKRRGLLLVLSSPSGAGKSTLSRILLQQDENITLSVSMTTRPPRAGEQDGVDYNFVTVEEFETLVAEDGFLEHAKVFDNYYGTPAAPVEAAMAAGRDVLFDIDWQGTQQLSQKVAKDLVRVFILPPSKETLESRLKSRAQDSDEVVAKRMSKANQEISHWAEYDYIIVNDDLEKAEQELFSILRAERLKRERQTGLVQFVHDITGEE
ncbi:guanylate kinase [Paremcibacter congregatus]|uniref:Guanylate kinase n=1 Tax=Paremcibacter congregatus TaxID=2043170 RepID=A0A2G4YUX9_9PROT|nr:guanylate kinase [Paremcibacter congregatus]PHZ86097.1 guanylate kinase [Paremcibacter congregatus]QDE27063.1 guanylate kinase [Paremcibacter congregatus]|tara:strand:+ start:4629 stop:5264 length:636 start_codon:yes stop_codon:yes gene_type:complete